MTILRFCLLLCFLVYISTSISPKYGVLFAFLSWSMPFWVVLQASLFVVSVCFYKLPITDWLLNVLALFLFTPFVLATYNFWGNNKLLASPPIGAFSVLSYNVSVFNSYTNLETKKPHSSKNMRKWITENEATVQCLQEFYHVNGSPDFDMVKQLATQRGYAYHIGKTNLLNSPTGYFGLIILSKLPIIQRGELPFAHQEAYYQRGIWIDVLRGQDTVRIINVHLASVALNSEQDWYSVGKALANGFMNRAKQVECLTKFIADTPHKTILVGDFNDLPYSYSYQAIKRQLYNAFEMRGAGFGFTHEGFHSLPPILRIDNQFYGKGLACLAYQTCYEQRDSDHTPIIGMYK